MRILIIANPIVGIRKDKRSIIEEVISQITHHGGTTDITYTMKPGLGKKHSSRAALEGYDAVYAVGGDGTVNDVASGLVGCNLPLGIIPIGTGNGLARGLGIPLDTKSIIDTLLKNKTTSIDIGKISSRIFLATAGIGYDAYIAHDFNRSRNLKNGIQKYFYLAAKNYFLRHPEKLTLVIDGKEIRRTVFGLTICNTTQYGGGAIIAPQADPRNGKLVVVLIPKLNVWKILLATRKLFNGKIREIKELEYFDFKTLKIKRNKKDLVHVDGEAFEGDDTLNISIMPSSLKIITP